MSARHFGRMFRSLRPATFGANEAETAANLGLLADAMTADPDPMKDGQDAEEICCSLNAALLRPRKSWRTFRFRTTSGWSSVPKYQSIGTRTSSAEGNHSALALMQAESAARSLRTTLSRTPSQAGNNLTLELDMRLQQVAEIAFGDRRGALVAIDPSSGGVLALVSKPGFDPNSAVPTRTMVAPSSTAIS